MKAVDLDSKASMYPAFAAARARMENAVNSTHFTFEERHYAIVARDLLDEAYAFNEIYINYRKTCISIKMDNPIVRDRKMAKELDDIFEDRGIVKIHTPQGLLFRIKPGKSVAL